MDTTVLEKIDTIIELGDEWNVVFHNDDRTSMEFVIAVLMKVFKLSMSDASNIMLKVHVDGQATVASYSTYDIAEQKASETMEYARMSGYPLVVTVEQ